MLQSFFRRAKHEPRKKANNQNARDASFSKERGTERKGENDPPKAGSFWLGHDPKKKDSFLSGHDPPQSKPVRAEHAPIRKDSSQAEQGPLRKDSSRLEHNLPRKDSFRSEQQDASLRQDSFRGEHHDSPRNHSFRLPRPRNARGGSRKIEDGYEGSRKIEDGYEGSRKIEDDYEGSRKIEDEYRSEADASKRLLYNNGICLDTAPDKFMSNSASPSTPVSRCPSNIEMLMPSSLPPSSGFKKQPPVQALVPRAKQRAIISKAREGAAGYLTDSASSDCSSESGIVHEVFSHYRRNHEGNEPSKLCSVHEDSQRFPGHFPTHSPVRFDGTQPGSPIGAVSSQRVEFRNGQGEGGDLHIHIHVNNGVQNSASNSTFSSPVLSPRALAPQEPTWLWNPTTNHLQQTSSTTSGHNSGHNSISSDFPLQHRRPSSDLSPRIQSRSVSPQNALISCTGYDSSSWADGHPLPLPPTSGTATASPSTPLSPRSAGVPPRSPPGSRMESRGSIGKWQKGRLLGSGSFGKVYKGIHSETGEFCAIKEVEFVWEDPKSRESAKQLAQEVALLGNLRHPNIVHYKGSEMVGGSLYIYLELVSGGSIYKLYREFRRFEEAVIRRYTRQILQGLQFLHSKNTVHRDIKGANILVDQDGTVKLADFGMAKHIKEQGVPLSFKGSPYWMAPEVIMQRNTGYEFAVDIWSVGCTVVEMVTGKPPWSEYEGVAAMFKVTRAETPPIPENLSPEGQSFIRLCLQRNPADRPSAMALLEHPFVRIPNDGPINVPDMALDIGERSIWQHENNQAYRGSLRWAGPEIPNAGVDSRTSLHPSVSAPVSPKTSSPILGGLLPTHLAGVLPGFSMPPTPAGLLAPGFNMSHGLGSRSNDVPRRNGVRSDSKYATIPASLHVTVNGGDSQWDIMSQNRQIPRNHPHRPNNNEIYVSRGSQAIDEIEQATRKSVKNGRETKRSLA